MRCSMWTLLWKGRMNTVKNTANFLNTCSCSGCLDTVWPHTHPSSDRVVIWHVKSDVEPSASLLSEEVKLLIAPGSYAWLDGLSCDLPEIPEMKQKCIIQIKFEGLCVICSREKYICIVCTLENPENITDLRTYTRVWGRYRCLKIRYQLSSNCVTLLLQQIMKDRWINAGFEEDELKPYTEPELDITDQKRIGKTPAEGSLFGHLSSYQTF